MILAAHYQKQINKGGLINLLHLKIGAIFMLTINIDIQDHSINFQVGKVFQIDSAQNSVRKVYVKFFDPQAGLKVMTARHLIRKHSLVKIEKIETEIPIKKGSTSPSIKRTYFFYPYHEHQLFKRSKASAWIKVQLI